MKKDNFQKVLLLVSVVLGALVGLGSVPIMTRGFSDGELALASLILLFNGMFGVFDFFRPVYVSTFAGSAIRISVGDIVRSSCVIVLLTSVFFIPPYFYVFSDYISAFSYVIIFCSFVLFVFSTGLWGALDANRQVGLSSFLRVIGTSLVYAMFAVMALTGGWSLEIFTLVLFGSQLIVMIATILFSLSLLERTLKVNVGRRFYKQGFLTFFQNASKIIIDFSDRLFIAKFFSGAFVGIYNVFYDVSSRSNTPSQLVSSYYYPRLCGDPGSIPSFMKLGLMMSTLILIVALAFFLAGGKLVSLYFGSDMYEYSDLFTSMLTLWSLFSLAFFAQSVMRSSEQYGVLLSMFGVSSILGLVLMYPLYQWLGLSGILIAVLVMKLPGVIGYWCLRAHLGLHVFSFLLLVFFQVFLFLLSLDFPVKN
tara:strand:+ start:2530 stop:3795 length:1266 start_codon:yes stop_codon:yes gene_type:complete